jgi:formate-dependent nitrite reductase cytochrome c552 subunit
MSCHSIVKKDSPALAPIRESFETGNPVPWVKIHQVPDYVYFNHSIHVNRGISCVECHGKINEMEVVHHDKPLSMSFCLDCHRNPEEKIRPLDKVYDLNWKAASEEEQLKNGTTLVHDWKVNPPTSCSGCHR